MCPTQEGTVEKNPPFPSPLTMIKAMKGPRDVDTGHTISMLIALTIMDKERLLMGPTISPNRPKLTRPAAEDKLNPARRRDPVAVDNPNDEA
jgi:hypothetical protein